MKLIKNAIVYILLITILCMSFSSPLCVYASESNNIPDWVFDDNGELTRQGKMFLLQHAMAKNGFIFNIKDYMEDDELYNSIMETDPFNVKRDLDNPAKILSVSISKDGLTKLHDILKDKVKNKYGYTLMKTVAKTSLTASMFPSVTQFNNMLKTFRYSSNNMVLMRQDTFTPNSANNGLCKLYYAPLNYYIENSKDYGNNVNSCMIVNKGNSYGFYNTYKGSSVSFGVNYVYASDTLSNDYFTQKTTEYSFVLADMFDVDKPLNYYSFFYLVTSTGYVVPVFNSYADAVNYSVKNNLYYCGSNFNGEFKDITVNYTELNKVMNGYYDGIYDRLQDLIDKSGDSITPEQLQQLVDDILSKLDENFDDIEQGQEQSNTWLEKIYNAIIDLPNKITHNDNNSNDIDLTELNKSLTTVISKLDNINNKLNNIDTDNDNEKLTDIETAIIDNKTVLNGIKTELTSQSADIKEITTQLQSVADSLKDLSSDVAIINTELTDMSNQLDNISKNLKDLAVTLENIEKELKDTNGLLADIKDTLKAIKNWLVADTIFDGIDLISDLADFIKDFMSDIDTGIATISSGLSEVAETFTKKFPFSIPWDIVFLIEFLADTPATPVFELPLKFDSFGIDEIIKIDFSRFEIISKISRLLLTMLFTLGLAKFTYNIISVKQGDN